MNISINCDCTPEEARRFMGLPDLSSIHEAYLARVRGTIENGVTPDMVEGMMKNWGPMGEASMTFWRQMIEQMGGPKGVIPDADSGRTIFALSSGAPPAAIAIVRISGPDAGDSLRALGAAPPEPRRTRLATLRDPADGAMLDRALVLWTPGPGSATGEDVAELHLHGGRAVVAAVLRVLGRLPGLRTAEPGEFTRRAFRNGRIDLLEAEGLADLLAAETEAGRRAALVGIDGGLGRLIAGWRTRVLDLSAAIEAEIEFAEEDIAIAPAGEAIAPGLAALCEEMSEALASPSTERLHGGARIVIAGPPNAGKSTLLNALAGREAAIVSPIPGTTRDIVEAAISLAGRPVVLCDTAGLRDSDDTVEAIGIARASQCIMTADLLVWLGDPLDAPPHRSCVTVAAKADIRPERGRADIDVSAVTGAGMATLRGLLSERTDQLLDDGRAMLNERQRASIGTALRALTAASLASDLIIIGEELRAALRAIDGISARDQPEDVLDALFSRFCIGK